MKARAAQSASTAYVLACLVVCQCGLHGCLAGMRVALPLQALGQGSSKFMIGLLVASFALLPALTALKFGRFTDRYGYHVPTFIAITLSLFSAVICFFSNSLPAVLLAAGLCGAGSGFGMITIQRTASRLVSSATQRMKVFSWVALAPAIGGSVGPVLTGGLADAFGFKAAFAALAVLPTLSLFAVLLVPANAGSATVEERQAAASGKAWDLFKITALKRILLINLLVVASWDVHSFALPILGHERNLSATSVGIIFSAYAGASLVVRGVLPFVASFLPYRWVPVIALSCLALVFAVYPLVPGIWMLMVCAMLLGVVIGVLQPSIMSILNDASPAGRLGECLALRSTLNQLSMTLLPLAYGVLGGLMGVAGMFWSMSIALCLGVWLSLYAVRS